MSDAITNLGGGGLSTPFLANLANSLNYAMGCLTTLFGGPLINKLGIKWSCVIAACVFPLSGSSYYVSAKYGGNAYLLASQVGFPPLILEKGGVVVGSMADVLLFLGHLGSRIWVLIRGRNDGHVILSPCG